MSSVESVRTPRPAVAIQVAFVVFSGLALSWLAVNVPIYIVVAAFVAVAFCIVLLQRPDLGLLAVLIVRASSDVSVWMMGAVADTGGVKGTFLTPNAGLVLLLVLCGSLYILSRRIPFISLPGGILFTLLQLGGVVAMLRSPNVLQGLNAWLAVTSAIVVYALAAHVFRSPGSIQRVIDTLAISFIPPAVLGFSQLTSSGPHYGQELGVIRVQGTFVHPNAFGNYLVLILSVFLTQAIAQRGSRRLLALLIMAASLALLALTYDRAAWTGALIVVLTVGLLGRRAVLVSALIGLVAVSILAPSLVGRVQLADPKQSSSLTDRFGIWDASLREWRSDTANDDSLFVTVLNRLAGVGPGSAQILTARFENAPLPAHNDYLRVLIEYGAFGLTLFLLLEGALVIFAYRTWRRATDKVMRSIALSFLAAALAYPIMYLTDNMFGYTQNQIFFWTLAGLTVAISRIPSGREVRHGSAPEASRPHLKPLLRGTG